MEQLNINHILDRNQEEKKFIECLEHFEKEKQNILTKRGVYIFGSPGAGKTVFVKQIMKIIKHM